MEWSHPAPRMREFILAMRAIWAAWNDGTKLASAGEFYTHTLMTPFFDSGPNPHGPPQVSSPRREKYRGAGEAPTACSSTASPPVVPARLNPAGRRRGVTRAVATWPPSSCRPRSIVRGTDDEELSAAPRPSVADPPLRLHPRLHGAAHHGWEAIGGSNALSKRGKWARWRPHTDECSPLRVVGGPDERSAPPSAPGSANHRPVASTPVQSDPEHVPGPHRLRA